MRTETLKRYYSKLVVSDLVLDDGPLFMEQLDRLKATFHRTLEREHRVMAGAIEYEQEYNPTRNEMTIVVHAMTMRDQHWVDAIEAEARAAVAEDQRWLAEQGGH